MEAVGTLRVIIENLVDAQRGLETLGAEAKDETLKRHFLAESLKRAEFRGELENILNQEGVRDVEASGTAAGVVKRTWVELKAKLGASDASLLATAAEEEEASMLAYEDAMSRGLPLPIRQELARQAAHIQEAHAFLRSANADAA